MRNAWAIVAEGRERELPRRALVIAVATAMQESTLFNLASRAVPASLDYPHDAVAAGDHDSVGLFQQRASWGFIGKRMNRRAAAGMFYANLVKVPGWAGMSLTVAAQAVQISAYPYAYAKHEGGARRIVSRLLRTHS